MILLRLSTSYNSTMLVDEKRLILIKNKYISVLSDKIKTYSLRLPSAQYVGEEEFQIDEDTYIYLFAIICGDASPNPHHIIDIQVIHQEVMIDDLIRELNEKHEVSF